MKILKNLLVSVLVFVCSLALTSCGKTKTDDNPLTGDYSSDEILIAYFSCTNHTKYVAQYIEDYTGGDLFEITPSDPYTDEDLAYSDSSSRTYVEDKDESARPEISNQVENIEDYKIVFLGYPIWFGKSPKIIYTFVETYESKLDGVVIIPFCTSSSSEMGKSAENLHSLASDAEWKNGKRFSSSASKSSVETWLKDLNLKLV